MPRFDLRVSHLDATWHTVGEAKDLDELPVAVAKSLALRIFEITGAAQHKPNDPEMVNKVERILAAVESASGPIDHATKNAVRKELDVAPMTREEVKAKKVVKGKGK